MIRMFGIRNDVAVNVSTFKPENFCVVFHAHHCATLPVEFLCEAPNDRLFTLKTVKHALEASEPWKQDLRLKLFRVVNANIKPQWLVDLEKVILESISQWVLLTREQDPKSFMMTREMEAIEWAYDNLIRTASNALVVFHYQFCKCGWSFENRNIFKYAKVGGRSERSYYVGADFGREITVQGRVQ